MAGNYTFIIVGVKDNPVYEAEFGQLARALPGTAADKVGGALIACIGAPSGASALQRAHMLTPCLCRPMGTRTAH